MGKKPAKFLPDNFLFLYLSIMGRNTRKKMSNNFRGWVFVGYFMIFRISCSKQHLMHSIRYITLLEYFLNTNAGTVSTFDSEEVFVTNTMARNISLLRQLGAPPSTVSFLVTNYPSSAFTKHAKFVEAVQQVMEMGFDPMKTVFVVAIQVLFKMKKPKLESRFELYKRWGWSKDMALAEFKRCPNCMLSLEEKITKIMNFLVNKIGLPSKHIATDPSLITLSLEKRTIPRCSVVQILLAKGLVKNNLALGTFLKLTERMFLEKFVIKFRDDVPQLLMYMRVRYLLYVGLQFEKVFEMENL